MVDAEMGQAVRPLKDCAWLRASSWKVIWIFFSPWSTPDSGPQYSCLRRERGASPSSPANAPRWWGKLRVSGFGLSNKGELLSDPCGSHVAPILPSEAAEHCTTCYRTPLSLLPISANRWLDCQPQYSTTWTSTISLSWWTLRLFPGHRVNMML